jgi:hypothetical protein
MGSGQCAVYRIRTLPPVVVVRSISGGLIYNTHGRPSNCSDASLGIYVQHVRRLLLLRLYPIDCYQMRSLYNNGYSAHLKEAGTATATLYSGGRQQTDGLLGQEVFLFSFWLAHLHV